ncbi:hypothetical protein CJD36_018095 [Flavipsychrobacter stenotrophus]|uniref:Uncharacterized protein n=1 Tax=Flavipsychrobacter stenotrophus TaxID=2077091 RepID=A0A2S7STK2_9BACT|nr:STM3941 family protein [Flavipsychrobacter stenotrophus]PQJ09836.1 hypothetical protein CJD36_018095 [Flavipsychrobacter stenotrophus]
MNEIKIYKSAWKGVKFILMSSLFVIPSIFFLVKGEERERLKFLLCIGFFGLGYPLGLSFILDRRPQIILNETGIFVRNLSDKIINWDIIQDAYPARINKQHFVCLKVDEVYSLARSKGRLYRSVVKFNKELGFQELNIWMDNVNVNNQKLLDLIQQAIHADLPQRKALLESGVV